MTNEQFVQQWFKNIDNHNYEANRALMHEEHEFHNPMTPEAIGPDEHAGMMQMMSSSFSGEHVITLTVSEGNHVAVRGYWEGSHTGEFEGIPATGKKVKFTWADFFQIVDGKVKKEAFEMNPASILDQIGALQTQNA